MTTLAAEAQPTLKKGLETTQSEWKRAVASGVKDALKSSCKATLESNKKTMTQCQW